MLFSSIVDEIASTGEQNMLEASLNGSTTKIRDYTAASLVD
jgi:hypothetical protein